MDSQGYRETYVAAFEVANSDLDHIFREYEKLQLRKEQLEEVLGAIEPFLRSAHELHQPQPIREEPARLEPVHEVSQPISRAKATPEPVVSAAFSPRSEAVVDPIQNRINHALGLAVA